MPQQTGKKRVSGQYGRKSRPAHQPSRGPRAPSGAVMLWGRHAVLAAIANPERRVAALHACDAGLDELRQAIAALPDERRSELPAIHEADRHRLDAVNQGTGADKAVHQGMAAAVWPLDAPDIETFLDGLDGRVGAGTPILLLDQISDPRNVGAIMRSALALGASGLVTTHKSAPAESGALARAAAGALERMPLVRVVNLARAIETIQRRDFEVIGLDASGDMPIVELGCVERLAVVLGAEGSGLRQLTRRHCDRLARIDISEHSESLNVATAAAIALYAAHR